MSEKGKWIGDFISHLESLRDENKRGALASLRRGMGSPPGTIASVYPEVLPWVPRNSWAERNGYIIASLFAMHPDSGGKGNLGKSFAFVKLKKPDNESLEKRFVALLNCHLDDLPGHLRQAVSLLKGEDIPVDWQQLLFDISHWDHESRYVQQQWARDYWQRITPEETSGQEELNNIDNEEEEIL